MSHSTHPRLVITGAGAITNLGLTAASTWEAMRAGRSGISAIEGQEFSTFPGRWGVEIGGQIKNFEVGKFIDFRKDQEL